MESIVQNQATTQQTQNSASEVTIMESLQNLGGEGTTSTIRTCFNGVNALSGVGILSIPFALSQGGWLSLILLLLVALVSCYTGLLLKRCMDTNSIIRTYPDIGQVAFGPKGRKLTAALIYFELFLVAVEFLILEGDILDMLFPNTTFTIGSLTIRGKKCFVLLTALIILPSTWLQNLGELAYVSAGGVVASIILVGCVLWVGASDVGFHGRSLLLDFGKLPTAISMFVFCYCGHTIFPTLCSSMRDRRRFPKVLFICFITSTITYGSMGVIGYLMYGELLKSQVTLNLPLKMVSTKLAIFTTLINPATKYALIVSPISSAIEHKFNSSNNSILIRTLVVSSTVAVALAIPFFGYVMSFTGAFLSVASAFMLPCLCYLKINEAARTFGIELVAIIGILIGGSLIGVIGTYISIKEIVSHL